MKGKIVKRSLALGALMAFVITGSAMAATFNLTAQYPINGTDQEKWDAYIPNAGFDKVIWDRNYYPGTGGNSKQVVFVTGDVSGNTVNINAKLPTTGNIKPLVFGAYAQKDSVTEVTGNIMNLESGSIIQEVHIGHSDGSGKIHGNQLFIKNGATLGNASVGMSAKDGDVYENHAFIEGGTVSSVKAGSSALGNVKNNTVTVTETAGNVGSVWGGSGSGKEEKEISGNKVYIKGGTFSANSGIYGGMGAKASGDCYDEFGNLLTSGAGNIATGKAAVISNEVHISGGMFSGTTNIYGGNGCGKIDGNIVSISENAQIYVKNSIFGGYTGVASATLTNNTVNISGGNLGEFGNNINDCLKIAGARTRGGRAENNSVNISSGTIKNAKIYGALNEAILGCTLTGNSVNISGGTVEGSITAASVSDSEDAGNVTNNKVTLSGMANVSAANLYGFGYAYVGGSGNNLVIDSSWTGGDAGRSILKIGRLNGIEFSNIKLGSSNFEVTTGSTEMIATDNSVDAIINNLVADENTDFASGVLVNTTIRMVVEDSSTIGFKTPTVVDKNIKPVVTDNGVRVHEFGDFTGTVSSTTSNEGQVYTITVNSTVTNSVLAGKYIDANGKETIGKNGELVLDANTSTEANIIAGAYANDLNVQDAEGIVTGTEPQEASGGKIVIAKDFGSNTVPNAENSTLYAGYSKNGAANNNTMTVNGGGLQEFNLYGRRENGTGSGNTLTFAAEADTTVNSIKYFDTINLNGGAVTSTEAIAGNDGNLTVNVNNPEAKLTAVDSGTDVTNLTINGNSAVTNSVSTPEEVIEKLKDSVDIGVNEKTINGAAGDVIGATSAKTDANGSIIAGTLQEEVNKDNDAIAEAGVNLKAHWRAHMNDMNKRMGELRNANGEQGVWTRMVRGESEYDGAKAQYNQYQLGYDEKLSVDKRWTVGAAITFAEGNSNYGTGSTEDDSTAFAIYGSKLNNDGSFIDLIARYARLESDLTDKTGKADYSTNGYSVSAEFGKRFTQENGMWIEPQVELTYGSIDSAEYKLPTKTVQVGDMDSLIGRVGFALGKNIKQGNVYARASYLYDFDGETESSFSNGLATRTIEDDLGGGWWEVGVGANINLSKATYIYADVEKTFGGEVDTNWQWNLGVRYSF